MTARPEFVSLAKAPSDYGAPSRVEAAVAEALRALELPQDFIREGERVVVKPNWVKEHDERKPGPGQWEHVITHPTVIEAVTRWAASKLSGRGAVIICDAPQTDSSFSKIREYCRLDEMAERCRADYPGVDIQILDLRPEEWTAIDGVTVSKAKLPGDPRGTTRVSLDDHSEFAGFSGCGRLYGASYDMDETNRHHTGGRHEYLLCRTPMDADVLINLPKLKTHRKVGLTCALKNLVGISANKNWLPHHTEGTPDMGGDQFPASTPRARLEHAWMGAIKARLRNHERLARLFVPVKRAGRLAFGDSLSVVRSGNWYGNDTCWRMILDLNKCLWYFDGEGRPLKEPRRYLCVVDGVVGGEGNGPLAPDPKSCGLIIAGTHPLAVDCVAATMMGFAWDKIPLLRNAFDIEPFNASGTRAEGLPFVPFRPEQIRAVSDEPGWTGGLGDIVGTFQFRAHFGWMGAIEAAKEPATAP